MVPPDSRRSSFAWQGHGGPCPRSVTLPSRSGIQGRGMPHRPRSCTFPGTWSPQAPRQVEAACVAELRGHGSQRPDRRFRGHRRGRRLAALGRSPAQARPRSSSGLPGLPERWWLRYSHERRHAPVTLCSERPRPERPRLGSVPGCGDTRPWLRQPEDPCCRQRIWSVTPHWFRHGQKRTGLMAAGRGLRGGRSRQQKSPPEGGQGHSDETAFRSIRP